MWTAPLLTARSLRRFIARKMSKEGGLVHLRFNYYRRKKHMEIYKVSMEDIKIVLQELDKSIAESLAFVEEDCGENKGNRELDRQNKAKALWEDGFTQGLYKAKRLIQACG